MRSSTQSCSLVSPSSWSLTAPRPHIHDSDAPLTVISYRLLAELRALRVYSYADVACLQRKEVSGPVLAPRGLLNADPYACTQVLDTLTESPSPPSPAANALRYSHHTALIMALIYNDEDREEGDYLLMPTGTLHVLPPRYARS